MDLSSRLRRSARQSSTFEPDDGADGAGSDELQDRLGNQGVQRLAAAGVQAKLAVGPVDDDYEREADHVADQVMGAGGDGDVQARMEQHTGADLGGVRIHDDARAHRAAASIGAHAFTHGRDIHFGKGAYDPASRAGQHLLAHELTHVVQQAGGQSSGVQRKAISAAPASVQRKGFLDLFKPIKKLFSKPKKKNLLEDTMREEQARYDMGGSKKVEPEVEEKKEPEHKVEEKQEEEYFTISDLGKDEQEEERSSDSDYESDETRYKRVRNGAYDAIGLLYDLLDKEHAGHRNYWGVKQALQSLWHAIDDQLDADALEKVAEDIGRDGEGIVGKLVEQGQATIGPHTCTAELQIGNGQLTGWDRMVTVGRALRRGDLGVANELVNRKDDWKTTFLHDRPLVGAMLKELWDRTPYEAGQQTLTCEHELTGLDQELQHGLENGASSETLYQRACERLKAVSVEISKLLAAYAGNGNQTEVDESEVDDVGSDEKTLSLEAKEEAKQEEEEEEEEEEEVDEEKVDEDEKYKTLGGLAPVKKVEQVAKIEEVKEEAKVEEVQHRPVVEFNFDEGEDEDQVKEQDIGQALAYLNELFGVLAKHAKHPRYWGAMKALQDLSDCCQHGSLAAEAIRSLDPSTFVGGLLADGKATVADRVFVARADLGDEMVMRKEAFRLAKQEASNGNLEGADRYINDNQAAKRTYERDRPAAGYLLLQLRNHLPGKREHLADDLEQELVRADQLIEVALLDQDDSERAYGKGCTTLRSVVQRVEKLLATEFAEEEYLELGKVEEKKVEEKQPERPWKPTPRGKNRR